MGAPTGRMKIWIPDVIERIERGEILTSKGVAEDYSVPQNSTQMVMSVLRLAGTIGGTFVKGRKKGRGYYFYHN
jgi:transcription initiation factor IIE alpha subunit